MNDPTPVRPDRFRAYRARKKAAGLREVRRWVPDPESPQFRAEARQAALLDHSEDEREAAAMMERLTAEARQDWQ